MEWLIEGMAIILWIFVSYIELLDYLLIGLLKYSSCFCWWYNVVDFWSLFTFYFVDRSYSYYVEVSMDQRDWVRVVDYSNYHCRSWQRLYIPQRVIRYIRIVGNNPYFLRFAIEIHKNKKDQVNLWLIRFSTFWLISNCNMSNDWVFKKFN